MKKTVNCVARGVIATSKYIQRHARELGVAVVTVAGAAAATAQTDATVIATNAQTAFGVIAPITISICGFYVILKIAKRVVH